MTPAASEGNVTITPIDPAVVVEVVEVEQDLGHEEDTQHEGEQGRR